MADLTKTVAIIFQGDISDADRKIATLDKGLADLGKTASATNIDSAATSIDKVGESAKATNVATDALGGQFKQLAASAGVPLQAIDGLEAALAKMGGVAGVGAAALAGTVLIAFAAAAVSAGNESVLFRTKVENLTGSAAEAGVAWDVVRKAVQEMSRDLGATADAYSRMLVQIDGTGISARVAENAFIGISNAVKGQGGDLKDAEKALKARKSSGDSAPEYSKLLENAARANGIGIENTREVVDRIFNES